MTTDELRAEFCKCFSQDGQKVGWAELQKFAKRCSESCEETEKDIIECLHYIYGTPMTDWHLEELRTRNNDIIEDFRHGASREELSDKYELSEPYISTIVRAIK